MEYIAVFIFGVSIGAMGVYILGIGMKIWKDRE